jgi:hypothetical protein
VVQLQAFQAHSSINIPKTKKTKKTLAPAPREPHQLGGKAVMASKTKSLGFNIILQHPVIVTHSTTTNLQGIHQHTHRTAQEIKPNKHGSFCIT